MITQDRPFLTTQQASYYLGLSHFTLERTRSEGKGPAFLRHARYVVVTGMAAPGPRI